MRKKGLSGLSVVRSVLAQIGFCLRENRIIKIERAKRRKKKPLAAFTPIRAIRPLLKYKFDLLLAKQDDSKRIYTYNERE